MNSVLCESMTKAKRAPITKAVSEAVLNEFRHRCAICGADRPQLHHIDEDPSNSVESNLIPLCPNCHLTDIHDPTCPPDNKKIAVFRRTRDPLVLDSKFHPIWERMRFLRIDNLPTPGLITWYTNELCSFIETFSKGDFYAKRIKNLIKKPTSYFRFKLLEDGISLSEEEIADSEKYRAEVIDFRRTQVENYCVELLRYQGWQTHEDRTRRHS